MRSFAGISNALIEYFAVYSPDTDKVYLIPVDHVGTTQAALRLTQPKNNNQWRHKMAVDYEL
jgi:PD-(D/E)XK endonuclease